MKKYVFFFALLFLLLGCKKGTGTFTVTGTIYDDSFECPLANANVELYGISIGNNQVSMVASGITDNTGKYQFSFPRTRTEKYVFKVTKNDYFTLEEDIYYSTLSLKTDNVRNYTTTAKSWVEIRLNNTNPSPVDHLQFIRQLGKSGCNECCSAGIQHFYGAQNTSLFCVNDGNKAYSIEYAVFGTANTGILQVNTTAFDTTILYLNY